MKNGKSAAFGKGFELVGPLMAATLRETYFAFFANWISSFELAGAVVRVAFVEANCF